MLLARFRYRIHHGVYRSPYPRWPELSELHSWGVLLYQQEYFFYQCIFRRLTFHFYQRALLIPERLLRQVWLELARPRKAIGLLPEGFQKRLTFFGSFFLTKMF